MNIHIEKKDIEEILKFLVNRSKFSIFFVISYPIIFLGYANMFKKVIPIFENKIVCYLIAIILTIVALFIWNIKKKNHLKRLQPFVKHIEFDDFNIKINDDSIKFVYHMGNYDIVKRENVIFKSIKKDYIFLSTPLVFKVIPLRYLNNTEKSKLINLVKKF